MASKLREERFKKNRLELDKINNTFRFALIIGVTCTIGLWIVLYIIYLLKAMILGASASIYIGETLVHNLFGAEYSNVDKPHADEFPHFWMFYLFSMGIATVAGNMCRYKKVNYLLFAAYFWTLIYGLFSIFTGKEGLLMSIFLIIGGALGLWITDLTFRLFTNLEALSLQEGFPDFIDVIDEPHPIANTNGIYYKQYVHMKNQIEKKKEIMRMQLDNPEYIPAPVPEDAFKKSEEFIPPSDEMDELSVDFDEPLEEMLKRPERLQ